MQTTATTPKMPGTPAPWINTVVRTMMNIPGLRSLLGKSLAILAVTGAKSGRQYSTPVQYMKIGNTYVVLSQSHRIWWRNIRTRPEVTLEVGSKVIRGTARVPEGLEAHKTLAACLEQNPRVAKFYGLTPGGDGSFDSRDIERLAERLVPIVISPMTDQR